MKNGYSKRTAMNPATLYHGKDIRRPEPNMMFDTKIGMALFFFIANIASWITAAPERMSISEMVPTHVSIEAARETPARREYVIDIGFFFKDWVRLLKNGDPSPSTLNVFTALRKKYMNIRPNRAV